MVDLLTEALNLNQFSALIVKMRILNIHSNSGHLEGEYQRSRQQQEDSAQQEESEQNYRSADTHS